MKAERESSGIAQLFP